MEQAGSEGVSVLYEGRMPSFPMCSLRASAAETAVNAPGKLPLRRNSPWGQDRFEDRSRPKPSEFAKMSVLYSDSPGTIEATHDGTFCKVAPVHLTQVPLPDFPDLAIAAGLALSVNLASAQEDADDEEDEVLELEDVRVTGSRLSRSPSEISGNLIVLDRDDIRASGELTLARVLRQLPQNTNPTHEDFFPSSTPQVTGPAQRA